MTEEKALSIPDFLGWTGDWETESQKAGHEYSAGKSAIEIAMARIFLIWQTGIWEAARTPVTVDAATGEVIGESKHMFDDFNDVIEWFESRWGFARSTVYDHLQMYRRMMELGTPLEIAMASMSHMQSSTKDLLSAVFKFEPRTQRLIGLNGESIGNVNLPALASPNGSLSVDDAKAIVTDFVSGKVQNILDGQESRSQVAQEIQHDILQRPRVACFSRQDGNVTVEWSYADGSDSGVSVLDMGPLPPTVKDILWRWLRVR